MDKLISTFRALSDKTRLRIMLALIQAKGPLCICELMDALGLAQYNISRQVRELKIAGLVQERKEGRFVFYSLSAPKENFYTLVLKAIESFDKKILAEDNKRLKKRLALRIDGKCVVGTKHCGC